MGSRTTESGARSARLMGFSEYNARRHRFPYVASISKAGGHLVYFGSEHTRDPANPQLRQIEREFQRTKPDLVFVEGGSPPVLPSDNEAVRRFGEMGWVTQLAARRGITAESLDPPFSREIAQLRPQFPEEQLKLFYALRQIPHFRPELPVERQAKWWLDQLSIQGLNCAPHTVEELKFAAGRMLPGIQWDKPGATLFDPTRTDGPTNAIARASMNVRDEFMLKKIGAALASGRRVFAIAGGSHVIRQERALRG
jgi:hypothetical protein